MNAIGYIRVSTDEQAREGVSLENQREKIVAYCSLNDMILVETITDEGISAKNLNREGMQTLISLVKHGKVNAVIVYKLDRLSRSVKDTISLIELFEKHKVAFHSIIDHIDTKTPQAGFFSTSCLRWPKWNGSSSENVPETPFLTRLSRVNVWGMFLMASLGPRQQDPHRRPQGAGGHCPYQNPP